MGVATNRTPTGDDRESLFLLREPFIFVSRTFSSLVLKVARLGLHQAGSRNVVKERGAARTDLPSIVTG
jgi:hypothetical protein